MPYAPGVQDISGQLLAQGMQQRAQGFAQGFTNFIGGIEQNKRMTNQALANFQGAVSANPNLLQFLESASNQEDPNAPKINPEIIKAFSEVKQGKTDVWNTALLANFSETYNKAAADSQMMQLKQAQISQLNAAAGYEQARTRQAQAEMTRQAEWLKQFGQPSADTSQPTNSGGEMQDGSIQSPQGRQVALDLYQETGKIPSNSAITSRMREMQMQARRQKAESQLFSSQDEALRDAQRKKEAGLLPPGQEFQIKFDRQAGGWFSETGTGFEPAETAAAREGAKKSAELKATEESDYLKKIESEGMSAMDSRYENQEIRRLLNSGIRTGPLEQLKNEYRKVAVNLDLADPEQIKTATGTDALDALMVQNQLRTVKEFTRGAQNSMEQKLGARAVANFDNKLPGANADLNDMAEAIKAKKEDHYRERMRLEETIDDRAKVIRELKKWDMAPQNRVNAYLERIRGSSAGPETASTGEGGPVTVTNQAQYDALPVGTQYRDSQGNLATKRGK